MKIVHLFNINNVAYTIATFLRRKGIDSDLIIDKNENFQGPHHPFWEEKNFVLDKEVAYKTELYKNNYPLPKWIKYIEKDIFFGRYGFYSFKLLNKIKKYDIIQAYTMGPLWTQFSNRPYIAFSTGADLDVLAFQNTFKGILMRRSYKKAKKILFFMPHQIDKIKKLKLNNSLFMSFPIDIKKYSIQKSEKIDLKSKYGSDFIFFNISRQNWKEKGSDKILMAFSQFAKNNENAILLCIDWGQDIEKSKSLVKELGITKNVKFIPLMSKKELYRYYDACDVVLDQFICGSLGVTTFESMSFEKPTITYVSENHYEECYPELPPVLNAKTTKEIYGRLIEIFYESQSKRKKIGEDSLKWIEKYHNWEKVVNNLKGLYENILSKES